MAVVVANVQYAFADIEPLVLPGGEKTVPVSGADEIPEGLGAGDVVMLLSRPSDSLVAREIAGALKLGCSVT